MVPQCHTCSAVLNEALDLPEMRTKIGRGRWARLCSECFLAAGGSLCDQCLWAVARYLVVDGVMTPTPMCAAHRHLHNVELDKARPW